ncbi:putative protein YyaP [BD1-7 clade bacterium]|uniref:Bacterial bifunctional deaminase-reductase C-terminal domain-containing protein n=1 Tax=BD1-7 clade bacterium TaxID=2029982 RepID=A0A5S9R103_9GAMM|nr:putative protein YyaP [BD1-7 clade bacterium]
MKCSVFIATSADGYIATPEGGVDWLQTAGNPKAEMGNNADMGFNAFIDSVDCMIMGRKCMEVIAAMHLTPEQWPYRDLPIVVLSKTVRKPLKGLGYHAEIFASDIGDLIKDLEGRGLKHAYVDGGATITSFINRRLINEMTITQAPILLGNGIPLFGTLEHSVMLEKPESMVFPNGFIQYTYSVGYT